MDVSLKPAIDASVHRGQLERCATTVALARDIVREMSAAAPICASQAFPLTPAAEAMAERVRLAHARG
jgi:hypothetical protein